MKFRVVYTFFSALLALILLLNFSGGPARTQGQDRTGGPFSEAPCQTCHSAGAFSPELVIEILDGDDPITDYEPGATYTFKATINTTGSPAEFGFQAVALSGEDDVNAGTFGTPDDDMSVVDLNGRSYVEHKSPRTENVFEIDWTAPGAGTGEVRIYAACVAANNGNSTAGDGSVFLVNPLTLNEGLVSVGEIDQQMVSLEVFPNPVQEQLNLRINLEQSSNLQLQIFDMSGKLIQSNQLSLLNGENSTSVDVSNLPQGIYSIFLSNGKDGITERILKQ
jgi:hypothetical protein